MQTFNGGDFVQLLFRDFKGDTNFALKAAVRHAEGPCVDEQDCSWERATLCAFDASTTTDQQVYFLKCMDEERVGTALDAAGKCASDPSVSPAITGITACYNDKAKSDALLKSAEADWNKAFPQRATIPHVFVAAPTPTRSTRRSTTRSAAREARRRCATSTWRRASSKAAAAARAGRRRRAARRGGTRAAHDRGTGKLAPSPGRARPRRPSSVRAARRQGAPARVRVACGIWKYTP